MSVADYDERDAMAALPRLSQSPHPVLLSIRERWVNAMIAGRKRLEFRRSWPKQAGPYFAAIYVPSPVKAVVAIAEVSQVHEGTPDHMTDLLRTVGGPETLREIEDYFAGTHRGAALEVTRIWRLRKPLSLGQLRDLGVHPPQSFIYLHNFPKLLAQLDTRWANEDLNTPVNF